MARARNIKPSFFTNEQLSECSLQARLLFIGLWTLADRDGRLEDRPKKIRVEVFPYDLFDCEPLLEELTRQRFIVRYEIEGQRYIAIPNFAKHQSPHKQEKPSTIPPPVNNGTSSESVQKLLDSVKSQSERNQPASEPVEKLLDAVTLNDERGMRNEERGMRSVDYAHSDFFPASRTDPPKIPPSLDTPEFREAFSKWMDYLRERGDVVVTSSGLEADLYELASHPVDVAIAMILYTRRRKAKGLITDGSHKRSREGPAFVTNGKPSGADKYRELFGDD